MSAVRAESVPAAQRGTELLSHRQSSSAHRRSRAIAWDLKEKSYLQACEKVGGGTHSSYELVIQSGS